MIVKFVPFSLTNKTLQKRIISSYRKGVCKLDIPQTKIIHLLSYVAMLALTGMIFFTLVSADLDSFNESFIQYLFCEANGTGTECDRSTFNQYSYIGNGLSSMVYLMMGLIPTFDLIFVISWRDAKRSLQHLCKTFYLSFFKHIGSSRKNVH